MNNGVKDRRVRLTVLMLQDALIKAIQTKHISKISVKQLCEMADINRSTFYSHFQDQYDLLEYTYKEVIENIKKHLETQSFTKKKPVSLQTMIRILDYVKENAALFNGLLSDNCDVNAQRQIMNIFLAYHPYEGLDQRTADYFSVFGLSGCVSILQLWLKDGMPESTTRMAEIILQAIDEGITNVKK